MSKYYPQTLSYCDLQELLQMEGSDFSEVADAEYVKKMIGEILWLRKTVRELSQKKV